MFTHLCLSEVLYVPRLHYNLCSIPKMMRDNHEYCVVIGGKQCTIVEREFGSVICRSQLKHGLFTFRAVVRKGNEHQCGAEESLSPDSEDENEGDVEEEEVLVSIISKELAHKRLSHTCDEYLRKLQDEGLMENDVVITMEDVLPEECEGCLKGKMKRSNIPKAKRQQETEVLGCLDVDATGTCSPSFSGNTSALCVCDAASRHRGAIPCISKSKYLPVLIDLIIKWERETGKKVQRIRIDGEGSLNSNAMREFCRVHHIELIVVPPYTPDQNGLAERTVGLLKDVARAYMKEKNLPDEFWAEAIVCAAYTLNRTPTSANNGFKTPFEVFHGTKPSLRRLRVFGTKAWVHIPKKKRKAWNDKSKPLIFVGYEAHSRNWRFIDEFGCIVKSSDAKFIDEVGHGSSYDVVEFLEDGEEKEGSETSSSEELEGPERQTRYGRRRRVRRDFYAPMVSYLARANVNIPQTVEEALRGPYAKEWREAMHVEFRTLIAKGTWKVVPRPLNRKVVTSKWCFDLKTDENDNVTRFKARFVARGFSQIPGVDYQEKFAPTCTPEGFRMLLTVAAIYDLDLRQIDFKGAFLNGILSEEVYLEQPKGFAVGDPMEFVLKLIKSLYGLVQSAYAWNKELDELLLKLGFTALMTEPCLYVRRNAGKDNFILFGVHVDDGLFVGPKDEIDEIVAEINDKFEIKDMREPKFFLGMHVSRDREGRTIALSQESMVRRILTEFQLEGMNPKATPMVTGLQLSRDMCPEEIDIELRSQYQRLAGLLRYLERMTRPDISFALKEVCKFLTNPGALHMKALKRIVAYLKSSPQRQLILGGSSTTLTLHIDADLGGNTDEGRSTCGLLIFIGSGLLSWQSKEERSPALSTQESEIYAMSKGLQRTEWCRLMLEELGFPMMEPIVVFEDNNAAMVWATSPRLGRSRHIRLQHFLIKFLVQKEKKYRLIKVSSDMALANMMTKSVPRAAFEWNRNQLNLHD